MTGGKQNVRNRLALTAFSLLLCARPSVASETDTPAEAGPIGPYSLASVTFEYTEGGPYGSTTTIVRGDGTGTRMSQGGLGREASQAITVEPKSVFELLELCYRKRFFELRNQIGPPNSPRLRPDGTIDVMATVIADGGGHHQGEYRQLLKGCGLF